MIYLFPGDPITMIDPGFKAPVVHLNIDVSEFADPDAYVDHVNAIGGNGERDAYILAEQSCYSATDAVETSSMSDYEASLNTDCSVDVSAGGGVFGVKVSGSFSFSQASKSFSKDVAGKKSSR